MIVGLSRAPLDVSLSLSARRAPPAFDSIAKSRAYRRARQLSDDVYPTTDLHSEAIYDRACFVYFTQPFALSDGLAPLFTLETDARTHTRRKTRGCSRTLVRPSCYRYLSFAPRCGPRSPRADYKQFAFVYSCRPSGKSAAAESHPSSEKSLLRVHIVYPARQR